MPDFDGKQRECSGFCCPRSRFVNPPGDSSDEQSLPDAGPQEVRGEVNRLMVLTISIRPAHVRQAAPIAFRWRSRIGHTTSLKAGGLLVPDSLTIAFQTIAAAL